MIEFNYLFRGDTKLKTVKAVMFSMLPSKIIDTAVFIYDPKTMYIHKSRNLHTGFVYKTRLEMQLEYYGVKP